MSKEPTETIKAFLSESPQILHQKDGVSFMVYTGLPEKPTWIKVQLSEQEAEKLGTWLVKGRASVEEMKRRYEAREESFAIIDGQEELPLLPSDRVG